MCVRFTILFGFLKYFWNRLQQQIKDLRRGEKKNANVQQQIALPLRTRLPEEGAGHIQHRRIDPVNGLWQGKASYKERRWFLSGFVDIPVQYNVFFYVYFCKCFLCPGPELFPVVVPLWRDMRITTCSITVRTCLWPSWSLCIHFVSPMDTSCAAGAHWKVQRGCSFNTTLPCAFEEAVMSCNRGHVIIAWILESDVRGKRKRANSQTKRAKVRGRLAEAQNGLKTFLLLFHFFFP